MKLKFDEAGHVVVHEGKPVYVHDDGKELPFDAPATIKAINDRGAENKKWRESYEAEAAKVKAFEGLDPEVARKAIEKTKDIEDGKLIAAGQLDKVKQEMEITFGEKLKATELKYEPVVKERDAFRSQLHNERLGAAFGQSKFIKERVAIPADLVRSHFGANFSVGDDGKIQAKAPDGSPVYSRVRAGEIAEFDEALEMMVDAYPYRDHILKGTGATGSGAGGSRTGANGQRQVSRAHFNTMSPADQMKTSEEALAGKAEIVD